MAEGVSGRLRSAGLRAGTVSVKIRDSGFRTITRQRTLAEPTDLTEPIWTAALELARPEVRGKRIRLVGVTASNLAAPEQLGLFGRDDERRRRAIEAADQVRRRYGQWAVTRARLLGAGIPAPFERDPMTPIDRRGLSDPTEAPDPEPRARELDDDRDSQPDIGPSDDPPVES
jgi:DNA polymerase-4